MDPLCQHPLKVLRKRLNIRTLRRSIIHNLLLRKEQTSQRSRMVHMIRKTFLDHDLLHTAVKSLPFLLQIFINLLMLIQILQLSKSCSHRNRITT